MLQDGDVIPEVADIKTTIARLWEKGRSSHEVEEQKVDSNRISRHYCTWASYGEVTQNVSVDPMVLVGSWAPCLPDRRTPGLLHV